MKKEIIMAVVIIVMVIAANYFTQKYTINVFNEIENDLIDIRSKIIENEDKENLKKSFKAIQNRWNKKYNILAYYIEHDELEKVEKQLWRIYAEINVEENNDSIVEIDECRFLIEHVKEKEKFRLVNIF